MGSQENPETDDAAGPGAPAPSGNEARTRTVHTPDGLRLAVDEYGDPTRPTVVLVHGYPDTQEVWSRVADRLAPDFHVVTYDVRGHGRSQTPDPLRGGFTLDKLTDDFLAVADAVSPDVPVHLVGHDWGSVQGWEFATVERTRHRIATFTSMSGPSLDHIGHWLKHRTKNPTPAHVAQLLGQGAKSWYVGFFHTPALPELAWRGPAGAAWPLVMRKLEKTPDDGYPTGTLRSDAATGVWLYRDNVRPRLRDPRPDADAHVPVQLIHPTGDGYVSARLFDQLDQWVPRLVRRELPGKHWAPRTRPDQLATWIRQFIDADVEHGRPLPEPGCYSERFSDQLVLVTGAAHGIGEATALAFAEAGARVIAVDRDAEGAARTARAARTRGAAEAWAETADVSDEAQMERLAATVAETYGTVDVLVNNAGIGLAGPFLETSTEEWRQVLDVNLWGVIHGCLLFGRQMAERGQGGHIVNVASAAAFSPSRALPAYSTSKAAVLMLTQCLRAELAGQDIGVSAVCPGFVKTDITATTRHVGTGEKEQDRLRKTTGRAYRLRNYAPEKVASAIVRTVAENRAVVAVSAEARIGRTLARVSPRLTRALARAAKGPKRKK
ncbi:SDR family oxidoreductase [Streptomyces otsuchiensis]|uniref:SDR family oxidoreductase n=1 Tax=Streptomyces otsuchiensis TaxID=2681388 RepID=UPI001030545A|nr:SDR family oxidoreductase [Streptomyces otsuchiensis]